MSKGNGLIVSRFGAEVLLQDAEGAVHRAAVRRKLSDIVVGDRVEYQCPRPDEWVVTAILPRDNTLVRQYFRGRPRQIAANIDQVVLVIAPCPAPDWQMVDNLLASVRLMPANAVLLHNKSDFEDSAENLETLEQYRAMGYPVIDACAHDPDSLAPLKRQLADCTSVLIGQSGVGKTTLANQLIPGLEAPTRPVSEVSELGQHTTSAARLYILPSGGAIIDSPGIRDFTPMPIEKSQVQHGFVEFEPFLGQCRFHNCLHRDEPGCAIKQALEQGKISPRRYQSYRALIDVEG